MAGISLPQFSPIKRKRDRKDPARRIGDPAYDYARRALLKRIRETEDRARKRAEGAEDGMKTMRDVKPTQDGPHDEQSSQMRTGQSAKTQSEQTLYRPGRGEKRVAYEDPDADDDFQPIDSKPKKGRRNGSKRQKNVSSIPSSSKNVADASTVRATATRDTAIQSAIPFQGVTGAQGYPGPETLHQAPRPPRTYARPTTAVPAIPVPYSNQERHGNIESRAYRQVPQIVDNHTYTVQELQGGVYHEGGNDGGARGGIYDDLAWNATNSDTMFEAQWE